MSGTNQRSFVRRALEDTPIAMRLKRSYDLRRISEWRQRGRPAPPPHALKRAVVRMYRRRFDVQLFVETGTFHGDMIGALKGEFLRIVSIELDRKLHSAACRRFRDQPHIEIHRGDSATMLPLVLESINDPCIFWLDAHYSGVNTAKGETETPIMTELEAILNHRVKGHVILIDDARCFDGLHDYPLLGDVAELVRHSGLYSVVDSNDIIRICPLPRG